MDALRLRDGRALPEQELRWTFARASGPGGQSVNTTDSAVRLAWDAAQSAVLTDDERQRIMGRLARRVVDGTIVVTAREHRSQWANRQEAADRLVTLIDRALEPGPAARRPTRPSRAAKARRLNTKRQRGELKQLRSRPAPER